MIQVMVAAHGGLARELVHLAQLIVGAQSELAAVALEMHEGIEDLQRKLETRLRPRPEISGHLILVDMFGGTPSNVALAVAQNHAVKVLTGVNLPMVLEAIMHRALVDLPALAELVAKKGQMSIFDAGLLLKS